VTRRTPTDEEDRSMSTIEPPATTPPQPVTTAYWLYLVGGVLGLIGAVIVGVLIPLSISSATAATSQALQSQSSSGSTVSTGFVIGVAVTVSVVSIVLSIGFAVAMFLLAPRMRRGSNRARIALWVLAALQIVGAFGSYGVGAVHFLVVLAALMLTALPVSNAWFRSMKPVARQA
jgi:hypothetical protein